MAQIVAADPRLHLLCPAGIGDLAWIVCKFGPLAKKRKIKFWLPESEQKRCGDYLDMLKLDNGYLDNVALKTRWVWDRFQSPILPKTPGWVSLHANTTLEEGHRIETWYPRLPCVWPDTKIKGRNEDQPFAAMFVGTRHYMGGQLTVNEWVDIAKRISNTVAPVVFFGAGQDVEFLCEITSYVKCSVLVDRPFKEILSLMKSPQCRAVVGVASGPLIVNVYEGHAPTLLAYPSHLEKMPGTWEPLDKPWHACQLGALGTFVATGGVQRMVTG